VQDLNFVFQKLKYISNQLTSLNAPMKVITIDKVTLMKNIFFFSFTFFENEKEVKMDKRSNVESERERERKRKR